MYLWDLQTGKELKQMHGHPDRLWDLAFSADDNLALSGCNDGIARLWDLKTGKQLLELETHKGGRAWTVAFASDGKQAVTGGGDIHWSTSMRVTFSPFNSTSIRLLLLVMTMWFHLPVGFRISLVGLTRS